MPVGWAAVQVSSAVVLLVLIKPPSAFWHSVQNCPPTQSVSLKMFPKKYLPEDRLRQKICQSSPELRALAAKLEQVIAILHDVP